MCKVIQLYTVCQLWQVTFRLFGRSCDYFSERIHALAGLRREWNSLVIREVGKLGFERLKALCALGFVELVYLRQSDNGSVSAGLQEVQHIVVILARLVTRVYKLNDERYIALGAEKALHELRPTQLLALCRLGVAVAREIDKIHLVALKKVDGDSLSRYRADAGKILAVKKLVDKRRLADIRASRKNYLGLRESIELRRCAVRAVEFNDIKSHKNLTE